MTEYKKQTYTFPIGLTEEDRTMIDKVYATYPDLSRHKILRTMIRTGLRAELASPGELAPQLYHPPSGPPEVVGPAPPHKVEPPKVETPKVKKAEVEASKADIDAALAELGNNIDDNPFL